MNRMLIPFDERISGSCSVDAEGLSLKASEDAFEMVTLFENRITGEFTARMRVAAGASTSPHSHDMVEEIYVLDGEFADEERHYSKGHYCIRQAGVLHTTTSEQGALVLLIYRRTDLKP
jgi:quercetin dioxygenase-like cupin family protein